MTGYKGSASLKINSLYGLPARPKTVDQIDPDMDLDAFDEDYMASVDQDDLPYSELPVYD